LPVRGVAATIGRDRPRRARRLRESTDRAADAAAPTPLDRQGQRDPRCDRQHRFDAGDDADGAWGVGKTALAIAVAAACGADFPDGVTVVWLGSVRSAQLVAAEVATQLGLPRLGGQSYEDALSHWLDERDVLLVIDNCEHVVSAVADLVDALTARLPRLRVLATSREPLWIDGEMTVRLAPLSVVEPDASREDVDASPAVQLFRERAGARARAALDTERAARLIGEICRRVDGVPLAIELAAARVAGLDLEHIASHLDDLFHLLPQAARRADGAQRSLRATVEWSDALLTEEERRLLWRMAVFAGGFDLTAIKEVCATDGQTAAQVADLTARGSSRNRSSSSEMTAASINCSRRFASTEASSSPLPAKSTSSANDTRASTSASPSRHAPA
jgi:predicted ATPase